MNGATAGGSVAWNRDASGFWYTRYPRAGERPAADLNFYPADLLSPHGHGHGARRIRQLANNFRASPKSSCDLPTMASIVLARVANGDGGEFLHFMLLPDGQWHQITRFADHISQEAFGPDGTLYLLSRKDAPMGKLLALAPPAFSVANAKTVLTATRSSIDGFVQAGSHLYVRFMAGGPSKLFDVEAGKPDKAIDIPQVSVGGAIGGAGRQPASVRERKLRRSFGLVSLRSGERAGQEDRPVPNCAGGFQRRRSDPPDRHLERWHACADDHSAAQGHQARRQESHAAHRLMAATASASGRIFRCGGGCGWITAEYGWWPTCAAGRSLARPGTSKGA